MKSRKPVLVLLALLAALSLPQLSSALTLKLATDSGAEGSPAGKAIDHWAQMIEKRTNGKVKVQVFYQNQLGGQQNVFDMLMAGNVDMMLNWPMTSYDKRISMIYTPYMFLTWKGALDAYKPGGWLSDALNGVYQHLGLKLLGAWPEGFNGVATRDKYALTPEQAKSIKVRVPPVFPFAETVQALGYQTADIDWAELPTSLQTGVVDGSASNVIFYPYTYLRNDLKYYVRMKQNFITGLLTMNLDSWKKLSKSERKIVRDTAVIVMKNQFSAAKDRDEHYVKLWEKAGKKYIQPSSSQIEATALRVRKAVWPVEEKQIGKEEMDKIRAHAVKLN